MTRLVKPEVMLPVMPLIKPIAPFERERYAASCTAERRSSARFGPAAAVRIARACAGERRCP
jgi:hypothetical protein